MRLKVIPRFLSSQWIDEALYVCVGKKWLLQARQWLQSCINEAI